MHLTRRAEEIRHLEGQLKWLTQANLDEFVRHMHSLCLVDSPFTTTLKSYVGAIVVEKQMIGGGVGENHPRLKAIRARKRIEADKLSNYMEVARNETTSRLSELRKRAQIEE